MLAPSENILTSGATVVIDISSAAMSVCMMQRSASERNIQRHMPASRGAPSIAHLNNHKKSLASKQLLLAFVDSDLSVSEAVAKAIWSVAAVLLYVISKLI